MTSIPIVMDVGSHQLRLGFAGSENPELVMPCLVGTPKHPRVMLQSSEDFIGASALQNRGLLKLESPVDRGVVQNWPAMEKLLAMSFQKLGAKRDENPVLVTEPVLNPRRHRERLAESLFETFQVPALYVSLQPPLALYASGRTSGLVLDVGEGLTQAMPVYNGFMMPHAVVRSDLAGKDVTEALLFQLRRSGLSLVTTAERQIAREIKDATCFVSLNSAKDDVAANQPYRLPDGRIVDMSFERHRATEVLFNPLTMGMEVRAVHEALTDAIFKSDVDLRRDLLGSIVLAGGSTLTPGFAERLVFEVKQIAARHVRMGGPALPGDEGQLASFFGADEF